MAGIFANVDSDISKLRQLKAEIEKVKNALKSINVKVDIDIAQGLEAKLKSLTGQYDALVQKVSQAEGKIIASTQRINQAAEKIVKAQEQMAKASGVQSNASSNGGAAATASQAETASVQAQAKAYDELADEIDAVMGTRSQNIKRMLEEQNAIRLINAEIKNLTKYQGDNASISSSQQRRLEQLNASLMKHKTALSELRQSLNNSFKLDNSAATSMNALSQSLGRMRMAYRELTEEERKSPFGQELLASIQQADAKIKQLDATIGNHQRNVGNYASSWNGLGMSIQQIGRELPSLAMGWNTFFLAISNNLPILTDEIKRAKDEYNNLKKSGKSATPVWKQVVSSLLSWQTALTVGITLLTLYGDEIIEWVKGLFSARKEIDILADEQQQLNKAMSEARSSAVKQQTDLRVLYSMTQNVNASMESRLSAIRKLQQQYPAYFGNLSQEAILAGKASSAYQQLTKDLMAVAYANAYQKRMEELASQTIQEKRGLNADTNFMNRNKDTYEQHQKALERLEKAEENYKNKMFTNDVAKAAGELNSARSAVLATKRIADEYEEREKRAERHKKNIEKIERQMNAYGGEITKRQDVITKVENGGDIANEEKKRQEGERKANEDRIKNTEDVAKQLLALRRKNQEAEIDLMEEGREKKLAQIQLEYEEELAEIDRMEKEWAEKQGGETTVEQRVVLSQARTNARDKRDQSISDLEEEETKKRKERLEEEQKAMDEYLQKYGTYGEKVAATMRLFRTAMNADGVTEGEKLDLQKQMEEALQEIDFEKLKGEINWSAVFGNISAYTKKELEKVKAQLETFKASDEYEGFTPDNKEAVENALSEIQSAIDEKGGIFDAVVSSMERYKEACDELTAAQEELNAAMQSGDEKAIEAARNKVNQAENNRNNKKADLQSASEKAQDKVVGVANAIAQLGASSEMSLSQLGGVAESIGSLFGQLGSKIGGIIGAALSILDVIGKEGVEGFTKNLSKSLGSALTSLLEFGTFGLIDFGGLSNRNVDSQLESLTASNETLVQALDRLSDKMEEADVADKAGIYERQMANLQAQMANTQQQMQLAGDVHDDGFLGIGGSHSSNYKVDKGMTADDWRKVSEAVGRTVDSAAGFWTLSSEEMARVADEATVQYDKIKQLADDGARDAAQYMDTYITYYEQIEEAQKAYYESLTDVSFDTVRDNFKDALKNMKDDAEAFSEDLENMLQNAVLEALMDEYEPALDEWYKKFGEYIKDGTLDQWEADDLRRDYEAIVDEARKKYQATSDVLGFGKDDEETTPAQQASAAVTVQASQESVDMLAGRALAIQETGLQMLTQTTQQGLAITDIKGNTIAISASMLKMENIGENVRDILADSYLELVSIRENTGAIVKPIQQMQLDMEQVKQNTSRL